MDGPLLYQRNQGTGRKNPGLGEGTGTHEEGKGGGMRIKLSVDCTTYCSMGKPQKNEGAMT